MKIILGLIFLILYQVIIIAVQFFMFLPNKNEKILYCNLIAVNLVLTLSFYLVINYANDIFSFTNMISGAIYAIFPSVFLCSYLIDKNERYKELNLYSKNKKYDNKIIELYYKHYYDKFIPQYKVSKYYNFLVVLLMIPIIIDEYLFKRIFMYFIMIILNVLLVHATTESKLYEFNKSKGV